MQVLLLKKASKAALTTNFLSTILLNKNIEEGENVVYLDEKREIFTSKTANPPVQNRLDAFPMIELKNSVDQLRYGPVLLEAVALHTQTVPSRNIGLSESSHSNGNLVLALVVVDEPGFLLLKRGVVLAFLAEN